MKFKTIIWEKESVWFKREVTFEADSLDEANRILQTNPEEIEFEYGQTLVSLQSNIEYDTEDSKIEDGN